ncbi:MAG: serine/threonine protein kinase [Ahniella sp.]|nr:serine/threonine protein kinase [Ahniella sp.]
MPGLQELFDTLVELPLDQRDAWLDRECADQPALRAQLISLLAVDRKLANTTLKPATAGLVDWASAITGSSLRPGQTLGAFRILEPLGQGGMGVVFRAERFEGSVDQQVAIKVVRREYLDAAARARFELERQALATLDHPYIARLIDAAELPDGTPYFVMEFVDGLPINEFCARRQLDLRARVVLMRQVCQAVAHAHRHLIVHRDLKPGNILVGNEGLPKLLDFGIAKSIGTGIDENWSIQTGTAQRFFSPRYAAPEQLRGGPVNVGCDVYALGVLLYELFSGEPPFDFEGLSFGQIERLVLDVPAPAPSARILQQDAASRARARALRGDLDGIVLKCLRKEPGDRYDSVAQLDEDLERWLQGMPVRARHGHGWYRLSKFIARHRIAAGIAALSVLTLTGAAAALWQQNLALRAERDVSFQALSMMQDAFIAADPIRAAGADISARQILESARRRLELIAPEQPALYATLAQTIAQVDLSLGQANEAAVLLERASDAALRAGFNSEDRTWLRVMQARAQINADQLVEAQKTLDAANAGGGDPGPKWRAMQGRLWSIVGRSEEGLRMVQGALAEMSDLGPEDEYATSTRYAFAEAQGMGGNSAGEPATLDETLAWQQTKFSADHPQVLRTRLRRLIALRLANRAQEAVDEAQSVLAEVVRIFGPDTAEASYAHNALARSFESWAERTMPSLHTEMPWPPRFEPRVWTTPTPPGCNLTLPIRWMQRAGMTPKPSRFTATRWPRAFDAPAENPK